MAFDHLKVKPLSRATSTWANNIVDALNQLYGHLTSGEQDINVDEVLANYGFFKKNLFVQDRPVLKDGGPITVYDIHEYAREDITKAIDSSLRLVTIESYTGYLARMYIDKEGRVGVTILNPLDVYGNVLVRSVESISKPFFRKKIEEGKAFSVSHRFEGVASGSSVSVLFENPSGSQKKAYIQLVEVVSLAQAHVDIYRDVTKTAAGTQLTPLNLNMESDIESAMRIEYGGTYENGVLALNTVCPGGSGVRAIGGATEVGENLIMPSGRNILIVVTNASASSTDLSIRIIWYEE